jgi:DNA polymerase-3 subunit alpha
MAKMRKDFIEGMVNHSSVDRAFAEKFWGQLEAFADYCFNKSHSACYALIAVWTAYLKAHFPAAFMAALMTSDHDNTDRIAIEVAECRRMGIQVLAPDVNESFLEFGVLKEANSIRFGLGAVKNIGEGPIEAILAAREEGGPFTSVDDFAKRANAGVVNKKVWESLIKAGAMDSFDDRGKLLHNLDLLVGYASRAQKNALSGQIDIFGSLGAEEQLPALRLDEPDVVIKGQEKLGWEKELLGLYLSHHPLDDYESYLADKSVPIAQITTDHEGATVKIGGITTTVRKITTKNGATMAFVALEDKSGSLELVVFPKAYEKSPDLWQPDQVIRIQGKVSFKDRDGRMGTEAKVMVDRSELISYDKAEAYGKAHPLSEERKAEISKPLPTDITLTVPDLSDNVLLMRIRDVISRSQGDTNVFLVIGGDEPKTIKLPFKVTGDSKLIERLVNVVGENSVVVK